MHAFLATEPYKVEVKRDPETGAGRDDGAVLEAADRLFSLTVGAELWIDAPDAAPNPAIQLQLGIALSEPSVIDGEPMVETLHAMIAAAEKVVVSFKALLE